MGTELGVAIVCCVHACGRAPPALKEVPDTSIISRLRPLRAQLNIFARKAGLERQA